MTRPVAIFEDAVKDYPAGWLGQSRLRAVDHVGFDVQPGEVFGLLGPNRAGKTTLVKMLLSLCRPTSGKIFRLDLPCDRRETLARIGYVHENPAFPRHFTARTLLQFYAALTLIPEDVVRQRMPALLERMGLADRSNEPITRFSKGMLQRLGLVQALLNDPQLLVLDEPSEGLDLAGRQLLRQIIAERRELGHSVLYVSHILNEVELVCDRLAVLAGGKLLFLGPLAQLRKDPASGAERSLEQALEELYKHAHIR